ncbi:Kae1-associated kinase Bud32 [Stetteria hydrogenophila]
MASRLLAGSASRLPLVARGAEAEIHVGAFMGLRAVYKLRVPKGYMHPRLDASLRLRRTRREARVMIAARRAGARVPRVYAVFPAAGLVVMEYLEGPTLREVFNRDPGLGVSLSREAGRILGLIHRAGVVHGDYTTSNLVQTERGLYAIDFGLADFSESLEERAVDIHLYRRSLESAHASHAPQAFKEFTEGYRETAPNPGEVLERAEEIRLRGRYVEARRRSVWARMG